MIGLGNGQLVSLFLAYQTVASVSRAAPPLAAGGILKPLRRSAKGKKPSIGLLVSFGLNMRSGGVSTWS
jgi:hypothetical protein